MNTQKRYNILCTLAKERDKRNPTEPGKEVFLFFTGILVGMLITVTIDKLYEPQDMEVIVYPLELDETLYYEIPKGEEV